MALTVSLHCSDGVKWLQAGSYEQLYFKPKASPLLIQDGAVCLLTHATDM